MRIVYHCIYCDKKIYSDLIFKGDVRDISDWMRKKRRELSEKCECRK